MPPSLKMPSAARFDLSNCTTSDWPLAFLTRDNPRSLKGEVIRRLSPVGNRTSLNPNRISAGLFGTEFEGRAISTIPASAVPIGRPRAGFTIVASTGSPVRDVEEPLGPFMCRYHGGF